MGTSYVPDAHSGVAPLLQGLDGVGGLVGVIDYGFDR